MLGFEFKASTPHLGYKRDADASVRAILHVAIPKELDEMLLLNYERLLLVSMHKVNELKSAYFVSFY
jgi:hypothetical protein